MSMNKEWERIQTKTFTNWVNSHLVKRKEKIASLDEDLKTGVNLIKLLEVISEEDFGKYNANPKMRIQYVENIGKALKFIEAHDVKLAGIGPEEIADGNVKMTLGLIWTIILRFAIAGLSEEGLSAKEGLLLWCRKKTEPYDNVDVKDFTMSFQNGLAFCALIHRHRPDLIDYDSLEAGNKESNLNLAFDVAYDNLDVAKLLDAEDIVNIARPDERSIMTYVAQLYAVFSKYDLQERAGKRIGKVLSLAKELADMEAEYERRTTELNGNTTSKADEFANAGVSDNYAGCIADIEGFRAFKKGEHRSWVTEQTDLATLFGNIQSKRKANKRPHYTPPEGLTVEEAEAHLNNLIDSERARIAALYQQLREVKEQLKTAYAELANGFHDQLQNHKANLTSEEGSLEDQLAAAQDQLAQLNALNDQMPEIEAAKQSCDDANIDENEKTDHEPDDLLFDLNRYVKAFEKKVTFLEAQILAQQNDGVDPSMIEEFKETFKHFDTDNSGVLTRLEFKSGLSALGVISLDFEGGDKRFDAIFKQVAGDDNQVTFDEFVKYMVSTVEDGESADQLRDSFMVLSGGKPTVTVSELKIGQLSEGEIEQFCSIAPEDGNGNYDFNAYLEKMFA